MEMGKVDPLLKHVVDFVQSAQTFSCKISVAVGGLVIEGLLIPEAIFYKKWLMQNVYNDWQPVMREAYKATGTRLDAMADTVRELNRRSSQLFSDFHETRPLETSYINLYRVTIKSPNGEALESEFWRGHIEKIDGVLSIGNIGALPEEIGNDIYRGL